MLQVVYPANGHHTFEASTFLMGQTDAATLTCNGSAVRLVNGLFCHQVPLQAGKNELSLHASNGDSKSLTLHRDAGMAPPAHGLHPKAYGPHGTVYAMAGDMVDVWALADAKRLGVRLPGLLETQWLTPAGEEGWLDNRRAVFAELHQTTAPLPAKATFRGALALPVGVSHGVKAPLEWVFENDQGQQQVFTQPEAAIGIWQTPRPAVTTQEALTRFAPMDGQRGTPLLPNTHVWVRRLEEGWAELALSETDRLWVAIESLRFLEDQAPPRANRLQTARLSQPDNQTLRLTAPWSARVPVQVEARAADLLAVTLYHTEPGDDFIVQPPGLASQLSLAQPEARDRHTAGIRLGVPQLAGWQLKPEADALHVDIRLKPTRLQHIMLDAGHGGAETGSTAPNGVPEKTLNLTLASALKAALEAKSLRVSMTRTRDVDVSLAKRAELADSASPDLFLSLHHNALPDGRDPWTHRGFGAYYYHAFARPIAEKLIGGHFAALGLPDDALYFDNLAMTRIHSCPALLLETGYLTHPEEAALLLSPGFAEKLAPMLADAILRAY